MNEVRRRVFDAAGVAVAVLVCGTAGFYAIGHWSGRDDWTLIDCLYMTVISVTTVGYGEVLPGMDHMQWPRIFAMFVMVGGFASGGYLLSTLTSLIVEGDLGAVRRRKKMKKVIDGLRDHVIVCGAGSTGRHVVDEMIATGTPFVALDTDEARLLDVAKHHEGAVVPYIAGDATSDVVLADAGVARARGLVAALRDDKDNLFVVISARSVNPKVRIVARSADVRVVELLKKAGANSVVTPNFIGGMRIASEMLRPNVVEFLDEMLRDRDMNLRIEEVAIPRTSPFAGRTLRESRIRDVTDALVLAIREGEKGAFRYNPGPDTVLAGGTTLVLLGRSASVAKFRAAVGEGFAA